MTLLPKAWSLTLRAERRLRVFEKRILRQIFGPKKDKNCGWSVRETRVNIGITFAFRFHRRRISLVLFVPVDLSSFLRHLLQILLGVEVSSVARPGQKMS